MEGHRCVPQVCARGAGRCSSGALHAVCAAARVIHHAGVTRCGCSISADVRIKSAAPPGCELCANAVKLQWLAPTLPGLLRARNVDRSDRWIPKKEQMQVSPSSTAIEEPARRTRVQWRVCGVGSKASFPPGNVLRGRYPMAPSLTPAIPEASGCGGARPGCPSRPGSPSALQNSVQMRKIPVPKQPPVREA
jgi:hypothetical protein